MKWSKLIKEKEGLQEVNSDTKENKGGGNLRARPYPAKVSTC